MKNLFLVFSVLVFNWILAQNSTVDSTGLQLYKVKKTENFNLYDIDKLETYDAPILVENDFKYFNRNLFSLTDIGNDKYEKLEIPKGGTPVAWILNGEKMYAFWIFVKDDEAIYDCYEIYLIDEGAYGGLYSYNIYSYGKEKRDSIKMEKINNYIEKTFQTNWGYSYEPISIEFKKNSTEYYPEFEEIIKREAKSIPRIVNLYKRKIILSGHTDSSGNNDYNYNLSKKRVEVIKKRLLELGVEEKYFGKNKYFGEEQILNHCLNNVKCTDEENRVNRRVSVGTE